MVSPLNRLKGWPNFLVYILVDLGSLNGLAICISGKAVT